MTVDLLAPATLSGNVVRQGLLGSMPEAKDVYASLYRANPVNDPVGSVE